MVPYGDTLQLPVTDDLGNTAASNSMVYGLNGSFDGRAGKSNVNPSPSVCISSFAGLGLWERSLVLGSEENIVISLLLGALLLFLIAIVTMTSILCLLCKRARSYTVNAEV